MPTKPPRSRCSCERLLLLGGEDVTARVVPDGHREFPEVGAIEHRAVFSEECSPAMCACHRGECSIRGGDSLLMAEAIGLGEHENRRRSKLGRQGGRYGFVDVLAIVDTAHDEAGSDREHQDHTPSTMSARFSTRLITSLLPDLHTGCLDPRCPRGSVTTVAETVGNQDSDREREKLLTLARREGRQSARSGRHHRPRVNKTNDTLPRAIAIQPHRRWPGIHHHM